MAAAVRAWFIMFCKGCSPRREDPPAAEAEGPEEEEEDEEALASGKRSPRKAELADCFLGLARFTWKKIK